MSDAWYYRVVARHLLWYGIVVIAGAAIDYLVVMEYMK